MNTAELNIECLDIETYKAMFLYCSYNVKTGKKTQFEISSRTNNLLALVKFFRETTVDYFCSFNGVKFDGQVIQFIIDNYEDWLDFTTEQVIAQIYNFAQKTIDDSRYGLPCLYKEQFLDFKQIDLYLILHYDNMAKKSSLKWAAEFSLDGDIEELPIDFRQDSLNEIELESIVEYCWNDVMATYNLYKICIGETEHPDYKGKNKIQLRLDLIDEYKLSHVAINWNDVKIGTELNKKIYLELSGITYEQLGEKIKKRKTRTNFTFGDCFPDYMKFQTKEFNDFFDKIRNVKVNLNEKQEFSFDYKGTVYNFAKGGGHSADQPRILKPAVDEYLLDADVGSMYPNIIRKRKLSPVHLGQKWNDAYVLNIPKRLEAKKLYKETGEKKYDNFQECFKLVMNGNFGKLGDTYDWQYDPFCSMNVTIGGEIDIFMLLEDLELNGHHVISMNTDGLTALVKKDKIDNYYETCKKWETEVSNDILGNLEYVEYESLVQLSVNDYLATKKADWIYKDDKFQQILIDKPVEKRLKAKGDFLTSYELHKNKSKSVIPIALNKYFSQNIPIETTIKSHKNIFDFCIAKKASSDYYYQGVDRKTGKLTDYNKLIRYYNSTVGDKIYKIKKDSSDKTGPKSSQCESSSNHQILFNRPFIKENFADYNIDYNYYIEECWKIIKKLDPVSYKLKIKKDNGILSLF